MENILCKECGNICDNPKAPKGFCSYSCYEQFRKFNAEPNCECAICHRPMYLKPSRLKRIKNSPTCSKECANKLKAIYFSGKGNHQYGLIGDKNASFKGKETISNYGYILEYAPNHSFPHDKSIKGTRVLQHRLVIERNYEKFDKKYFVEIKGNFYLNPLYDVHHKNKNKKDNRVENLEIITRSDHTTLHNLEKEIIRDTSGRIIGVNKLSKNGEGCDANTVLNSEITKGSESV